MMSHSDPVPDGLAAELGAMLADADSAVAARRVPAPPDGPVHTCYVSAAAYTPGTVAAWGRAAQECLAAHGSAPELAEVLGLQPGLLAEVLPRVRRKLAVEPVEDLRVDFEDGYGAPPDDVEDAAATRVGGALAASRRVTRHVGVRIKSLEPATRIRAVRTLAGVLDAYLAARGDPAGLIVTLPKVSHPDQVRALDTACARLEALHGLTSPALRVEVQVELPAAVCGTDGVATAAALITAGADRVDGLHFGTYDYGAALGLDPLEQRADHPAAEHAKAVLQVAAAGRGVRVVDGSSNVLPVGDRPAVLAAWRIQARVIRRALHWGIGQGWDLHPAQLPCRYLVTFGHLRAGAPAVRARLAATRRAGPAAVQEDPATVQALTGYLERALARGALDPHEARLGPVLRPGT